MTDCAHWHRQELFEEAIAEKDREIMAAHQRTAALEEKLRRIRELTEGVEEANVSSLAEAFEVQRIRAIGKVQQLAFKSYLDLGSQCFIGRNGFFQF